MASDDPPDPALLQFVNQTYKSELRNDRVCARYFLQARLLSRERSRLEKRGTVY